MEVVDKSTRKTSLGEHEIRVDNLPWTLKVPTVTVPTVLHEREDEGNTWTLNPST